MQETPRASVRLELEGPILTSVENWRRSQPKIPSRSEAVRKLLERALRRSPNTAQQADRQS
jgi:hypothetical protein